MPKDKKAVNFNELLENFYSLQLSLNLNDKIWNQMAWKFCQSALQEITSLGNEIEKLQSRPGITITEEEIRQISEKFAQADKLQTEMYAKFLELNLSMFPSGSIPSISSSQEKTIAPAYH